MPSVKKCSVDTESIQVSHSLQNSIFLFVNLALAATMSRKHQIELSPCKIHAIENFLNSKASVKTQVEKAAGEEPELQVIEM